MSLILAGTYRLPPENIAELKTHVAEIVAATRQEPGCIEYANAEDATEPGLMRFFEIWRSQEDLDAHFGMPHMAAWRAAGNRLGVNDRRLVAYDIAGQRQL